MIPCVIRGVGRTLEKAERKGSSLAFSPFPSERYIFGNAEMVINYKRIFVRRFGHDDGRRGHAGGGVSQ